MGQSVWAATAPSGCCFDSMCHDWLGPGWGDITSGQCSGGFAISYATDLGGDGLPDFSYAWWLLIRRDAAAAGPFTQVGDPFGHRDRQRWRSP
jgi:hypothetical protein